MARPLRVDIANGWYHVTSRGIDRRVIFDDNRAHEHFLELLSEMVDRFRIILHAHVELDNHYHLIVQTPDANLSRAIQWLNVSYVSWFNRRRGRVGPLLQGRFKSIPVQDGSWAYELSLYVHLNPVMRKAYGLDKQSKKAESLGWIAPDAETVTRRLSALRQYPWSSYRAYTGYTKVPDWLCTKDILSRASRDKDLCTKKYRSDVKQRISKGVEPRLQETLADGFAIGTEVFRKKIRELGKDDREVSGSLQLRRRVSFDDLVACVEALCNEEYAAFMSRRGHYAKPLLLWSLRRFAGMTLKEVGEAVGGMDYTAVAMAIKRFEKRSEGNRKWMKCMKEVKLKCEK